MLPLSMAVYDIRLVVCINFVHMTCISYDLRTLRRKAASLCTNLQGEIFKIVRKLSSGH